MLEPAPHSGDPRCLVDDEQISWRSDLPRPAGDGEVSVPQPRSALQRRAVRHPAVENDGNGRPQEETSEDDERQRGCDTPKTLFESFGEPNECYRCRDDGGGEQVPSRETMDHRVLREHDQERERWCEQADEEEGSSRAEDIGP